MSYLKAHLPNAPTPQTEPIRGSKQVANSAGGFAYGTDPMTQLRRFLILGSAGGSYYASERKLTTTNLLGVELAFEHSPAEALQTVIDVSLQGRAPRQSPTLYCLAMACGSTNLELRKDAIAAIPKICRTGTMLFEFLTYAEGFRGWGRSFKRGVAAWYEQKDPGLLALQMVKYRQREGWTHRDVLRLAHPVATTPEHKALYDFACGREVEGDAYALLPPVVRGYHQAALAEDAKYAEKVALEFSLPREAIKPEHLTKPVWEALLPQMGITAMIRNLGNMSKHDVLTSQSQATTDVVAKITDPDVLAKGRVHPLNVLMAGSTYTSGKGFKGSGTWPVVPKISQALDDAFYAAFGAVKPTGKKIMLALDISGSMAWSPIAGTNITPRAASAAMALVTARVEKDAMVTAFSTGRLSKPGNYYQGVKQHTEGIDEIDIRATDRLPDVLNAIDSLYPGGTDCSLPMLYALKHDLRFDAFVVYTDSETWAGSMHPVEALKKYRAETGIDAKLIVVGMVSNEFSIADPDDGGMLDVVGFDTATPNLMSEFIEGSL